MSQKEELILTHRLGVDGVIYLSATGKISNDQLAKYSAWADEVKVMLKERSSAGISPILVLTDISGVTHFERQPVAVMRELLAYDRQFEIRSAVVGAGRFAAAVFDSIVSLLHRNNLKQFKNKEEALEWLHMNVHA